MTAWMLYDPKRREYLLRTLWPSLERAEEVLRLYRTAGGKPRPQFVRAEIVLVEIKRAA